MLQMRIFVAVISTIVVFGLGYVYTMPPPSMKLDRDGRPHFRPQVLDPESGRGIPLDELIRHYKGG